ncbi:hypothetical protein VPHK225_0059 [Vibrio phage K225]
MCYTYAYARFIKGYTCPRTPRPTIWTPPWYTRPSIRVDRGGRADGWTRDTCAAVQIERHGTYRHQDEQYIPIVPNPKRESRSRGDF